MSEHKLSQAERLLQLADIAGYWFLTCHDDPFGVLPGESIARPLRGGKGSIRAELSRLFSEDQGKAPSSNALTDTMLALEGRAYAGEERELHLRVARTADAVWLDLGDADGDLVRITGQGWETVTGCGPLFRRTRLTGRLPKPAHDGDLAALRGLLRIGDDSWPLIVAWLVSALLLPGQPVPVLALTGEHGTAKSWQSRVLVQLIDPSDAPLRTAPRDVESWAVAASASRVVALDNVSKVEPWLSDALCRAVTGDGLVRRALYTSSDVAVLAFRRTVLLNGITLAGIRGDLADRLLRVELEQLDDGDRLDEADLATRWEQTHPVALGGLLDLCAGVLAALPGIRLDRRPRMADYARILAAVDKVLGTDGIGSYLGQRRTLAAEVVEDDPVAKTIAAMAASRAAAGLDPWEGTAGELLEKLRPKDALDEWPHTPRGMAARLTRAAPALRATGTAVEHLPHIDHRHPRLWRIAQIAAQPSAPSAPSTDQGTPTSDTVPTADDRADGRTDGLSATVRPSANRPHETAGQDVTDGTDGSTPTRQLACPRHQTRYGPHPHCPDCQALAEPALVPAGDWPTEPPADLDEWLSET